MEGVPNFLNNVDDALKVGDGLNGPDTGHGTHNDAHLRANQ